MGKLTDDQRDVIVRRYTSGSSTCEIARDFNVSNQSVWELLKRRNIPTRSIAEATINDFAKTVAPETSATVRPAVSIWKTCISGRRAYKVIAALYGVAPIALARKEVAAKAILAAFGDAYGSYPQRAPNGWRPDVQHHV